MRVRAIIFDVYKTILDVGPAPDDVAQRWAGLWQETWERPPKMSLEEFNRQCEHEVAREQECARKAGVANPEIYWPDVTKHVLPELRKLSETGLDDFLHRHAQLLRTVRLMPGAAVLTEIAGAGKPLGIASNSQPYTLRELDAALASASLTRALFVPELCFWSFQAGFSKPDTHVFRLLTARLRALHITPHETLMVGDRVDNDLGPARAHGWQTWHLTEPHGKPDGHGGDWGQLVNHLREKGDI